MSQPPVSFDRGRTWRNNAPPPQPAAPVQPVVNITINHEPAPAPIPAAPAPAPLAAAAPRRPAVPQRTAAELDADIDNAFYAHLFPKEAHRG
jgi:hypothetical protein